MPESTKRPLKHNPRSRTFRFADNSKPQNRSPKDDRTLNKRGRQVELVRPKWRGKGPLIFRPLPAFCAESPTDFDPTHLSTDSYDLSDFIRGCKAMKYVGIDNKITALLYDPRWTNDGYDPYKENPYVVLYNAVISAVKEGEAIVRGKDVITSKWAPLTMDDSPKKAFNAPTMLYFMQGFIFESDGQSYVLGGALPKGAREEDLPQIIELSKTAGESIAKMLEEVNPNYNGDTDVDSQDAYYRYGDVVNLEYGSFVTVYNPSEHHDVIGAEEEGDDDERKFKGWKAAITRDYTYSEKRQPKVVEADITYLQEKVAEQVCWFDDILYFPETDELAMWLAGAFRSMPALLEFGWADNPEFFTDEVKGILANRTQGQGAEIPVDDEEEPAPIAPKARSTQRSSALAGARKKTEAVQEMTEFFDESLRDGHNSQTSGESDDYEENGYAEEKDEDGEEGFDPVSDELGESGDGAEEGGNDVTEDVTQTSEAQAAASYRSRMRQAPKAVGPTKGTVSATQKIANKERKVVATSSKPTPKRRA